MESLELKKCVTLVVQNYWYRDYPEDDWSIVVRSSSVESAIGDFWKNYYPESDININRIYFLDTLYVEYENKICIVKETEIECDGVKLFNNSPFKAPAIEKRNEIVDEKARKVAANYFAEKLAREKAEYERLKNQFED